MFQFLSVAFSPKFTQNPIPISRKYLNTPEDIQSQAKQQTEKSQQSKTCWNDDSPGRKNKVKGGHQTPHQKPCEFKREPQSLSRLCPSDSSPQPLVLTTLRCAAGRGRGDLICIKQESANMVGDRRGPRMIMRFSVAGDSYLVYSLLWPFFITVLASMTVSLWLLLSETQKFVLLLCYSLHFMQACKILDDF